MGLMSNVTRRGATYYARAAIPVDLQKRLGKLERWESLRTKDAQVAKRKVRTVLDRWDAEYDDLRRRQGLPEHDLQEAVWTRYVELTTADERFRQELPSDDDLDEIWRELEREFGEDNLHAFRIFEFIRDRFERDQKDRAARVAELRKHAARGETKLVSDAAQAEIASRKLDLEKGSPEYRRLAHGLLRAELEALARAEERDQGDFTGEPRDRLIAPPELRAAPAAAKRGETIMELFEDYARDNPKGVKQDTLNQSRMAVALFADTVGPRFPVAKIDKKAAREWKKLLGKYPVKAAEIAAFRGMSMQEIVQANETVGKPVISDRTINRYLSGLGAFCDWLVAHDYLAANPLSDMYKRLDKTKRTTLPFATDQLNTVFRSPLFTGCQSDEKIHLPGNHMIRDHRYWLPLIMLFSGARPGEIAQLLTADVRQMHGHWVMHITEEGDPTKSTKTKGSQRVVPVHPELQRLGFIAHCEAMRARGERRLFPEAERNARGQMAAKFSREFGRYLSRIGLKNGRGLSLYSFRHGFIDALRRAEFLDTQFGFLVGHTGHSTTGQYGVLPQGMLRQRVEMIEKVAYPGLSLDHLVP